MPEIGGGCMRRISLQKVIRDKSNSFIHDGKAHEGWEDVKPAVGEPYCIYCESGGILKTSDIEKINDGYLETLNSIYKLTVLEEEPFTLTGEKDSKVTRKYFLDQRAHEKG